MSKLEPLINRPRPLVMGILNTTPDSFSDGGRYFEKGDAKKRIEQMQRTMPRSE